MDIEQTLKEIASVASKLETVAVVVRQHAELEGMTGAEDLLFNLSRSLFTICEELVGRQLIDSSE